MKNRNTMICPTCPLTNGGDHFVCYILDAQLALLSVTLTTRGDLLGILLTFMSPKAASVTYMSKAGVGGESDRAGTQEHRRETEHWEHR